MNSNQETNFVRYGNGDELLVAFHGYGMDGNQFSILSSLYPKYQIVAFHLPFHVRNSTDHEWIKNVSKQIESLLAATSIHGFSLLGYSIGAKIALQFASIYHTQINHIFLFAPFGIEKHIGIQFISSVSGQHLFKFLNNTSLPIALMKLTKWMGIIDSELFGIVKFELSTKQKSEKLRKSLGMVGKIQVDIKNIIEKLNDRKSEIIVVYGKHDLLFPFEKRNTNLLKKILNLQVLIVNEGHWMITKKLDKLLASKVKLT